LGRSESNWIEEFGKNSRPAFRPMSGLERA